MLSLPIVESRQIGCSARTLIKQTVYRSSVPAALAPTKGDGVPQVEPNDCNEDIVQSASE